jgi:uncharacterized coiled-coil DUF342 family protein
MSAGKYDDDDLMRIAELVAEQMISQIKTELESIDEIKKRVSGIPEMQDDITELKSDVKAVKHAVKDTNTDLRKLDHRVTQLETSDYNA